MVRNRPGKETLGGSSKSTVEDETVFAEAQSREIEGVYKLARLDKGLARLETSNTRQSQE